MQQDLHRKKKHKREREKILKQNRLEKLIKQKGRKRKERRLKVLEKGNELIIM